MFRENSGAIRYVIEPYDDIEDSSSDDEIGLYYEFEKKNVGTTMGRILHFH